MEMPKDVGFGSGGATLDLMAATMHLRDSKMWRPRKLEYTATLIPLIWRQLGCKSSVDAMLNFLSDKDENYESVAALRAGGSMNEKMESSEEIRKLMMRLLTTMSQCSAKTWALLDRSCERTLRLQFLELSP